MKFYDLAVIINQFSRFLDKPQQHYWLALRPTIKLITCSLAAHSLAAQFILLPRGLSFSSTDFFLLAVII